MSYIVSLSSDRFFFTIDGLQVFMFVSLCSNVSSSLYQGSVCDLWTWLFEGSEVVEKTYFKNVLAIFDGVTSLFEQIGI